MVGGLLEKPESPVYGIERSSNRFINIYSQKQISVPELLQANKSPISIIYSNSKVSHLKSLGGQKSAF
jgi:hypothetical protein